MDENIGTYAPLAIVCDECGSIEGREEHDAACWRGFVLAAEEVNIEHGDDSSDFSWR